MKIEMGESLFYSWLRHVKECQIVQTNWKPSPSWEVHNEDLLQTLKDVTDVFFRDKYDYAIYKTNSLSQLLQQAELDALGICESRDGSSVYAIDVAFHEAGLNYGSKQETVMKLAMKLIRAAMCLIAYFDVRDGELIFASPKIHNSVMEDLNPCIDDVNNLFEANGYNFKARVIANDDFKEHVLKPIILASNGVADTSELFMRGYQLVNMFGFNDEKPTTQRTAGVSQRVEATDALAEFKIGKIAQTFLRKALEDGKADDNEVELMQTKDYSKKTFGLDLPLLVSADADVDSVRYYATPLFIRGVQFRLCSQWFEVSANNDRPQLLAWLNSK